MKLIAIFRLIKITFILIKYQIDRVFIDLPFIPWWFKLFYKVLPWSWLPKKNDNSKGYRIRTSLEELGPVFIKFGQILSTRQDILPPDIAQDLNKLQDKVSPFSSSIARIKIEKELGQKISNVFSYFSNEPIASASIAQVYAAELKSGEDVVVKVIRPNLKTIITSDISWLYSLARVLEFFSNDAKRLHLTEVVLDYEKTIHDELDLLREAANTSQLKRNFKDSTLLYIPTIYWDYCRAQVLVMERIHGIPVNNIGALQKQNTNVKFLAEKGVEIFFTQVFRDNFFHADMHPGNIFVSNKTPENPMYIAIDCGIVGSLTDEDKNYLAKNLLAFFNRDYYQVAQLHIDSGWIPKTTKVNDFESAIRTVCEPIFEKPLKDISFGQVLIRLFDTARRFNMEVQPQLILLQKTLLNIEGLGRQLYPELDLWATAQPFLKKWIKEQNSPKNILYKLKFQIEQAAHLNNQAHKYLIEKNNQLKSNNTLCGKKKNLYVKNIIGITLLGLSFNIGITSDIISSWKAWLTLVIAIYVILFFNKE